jgi:hypothetical protein
MPKFISSKPQSPLRLLQQPVVFLGDKGNGKRASLIDSLFFVDKGDQVIGMNMHLCPFFGGFALWLTPVSVVLKIFVVFLHVKADLAFNKNRLFF